MNDEIKKSAEEFLSLLDKRVDLEKRAKQHITQAQRFAKDARSKPKTEAKKFMVAATKLTKSAAEYEKEARGIQEQMEEMTRTMPPEAVELIRNASIDPYGQNIADQSLKGKHFNFMHTNLKTEYMRRELMVSLVSFVYQMLEEYQTEPEDELRAKLNIKGLKKDEREKIERALDALDARRQWTRNFLDGIFEFDPLEHVRGSQLHRRKPGWLSKTRIVKHTERVDVPRSTLREPNSGAYVVLEKDADGKEVERVVKDRVVEELVRPRDPEARPNPNHPHEQRANQLLERNVPADTFARWRRFETAQYEGIRRAVQIAYAEKPDVEVALQVCSIHDKDKAAREWRLREQDKVPCDILSGRLADGWVLLGPFHENRKRVDFYNKNTETLKLALEQIEADQKLGRELMEKRIERRKRENIREAGPDAPGLHKKYTPATTGGAHVSKTGERPLDGNRMRELEREVEDEQESGSSSRANNRAAPAPEYESEQSLDELLHETKKASLSGHAVPEAVPDDAVAVDMHVYDTATGTVQQSHFLTESEDSAEAKIGRGFGQ